MRKRLKKKNRKQLESYRYTMDICADAAYLVMRELEMWSTHLQANLSDMDTGKLDKGNRRVSTAIRALSRVE